MRLFPLCDVYGQIRSFPDCNSRFPSCRSGSPPGSFLPPGDCMAILVGRMPVRFPREVPFPYMRKAPGKEAVSAHSSPPFFPPDGSNPSCLRRISLPGSDPLSSNHHRVSTGCPHPIQYPSFLSLKNLHRLPPDKKPLPWNGYRIQTEVVQLYCKHYVPLISEAYFLRMPERGCPRPY